MTRWIRGRLGRPIASVIYTFMLVSLLLPLAPPQAQAQFTNLSKLLGSGEVKETTPIVVVDFNNRSSYAPGMLGRTFADALSMELMRTGTFEVIKRQQVEQVMDENNLTTPLNWAQQALVAERLSTPTGQCNYTVSGDIEDVRIHKTKEGTSAEVTVRMLVISRITGMPINGTFVVQSSSPKIGYSGNNDVLVHEALATAAFQSVMKLMDNRLPIGTILTSPRSGEVVIKGGSTVGFRVGMECTSIRRDSVTGRIRVIDVTPNESTGVVLEESKGIAPGDKVVPIFEFASTSSHVKKSAINSAGLQLAALAAGAILVELINTENSNKSMNIAAAPTATALADAMTLNDSDGANLVTWKRPSSRVVAYEIWRDDSPMQQPIAIVDGNQNYYIDSTSPLPLPTDVAETFGVTVTLDSDLGTYTFNPTMAWQTAAGTTTTNFTLSATSYTNTTYRVPLSAGEKCGYSVRIIYMDYVKNGLSATAPTMPATYSLYIGSIGSISNRVTVVKPAPLVLPQDNQLPTDGTYVCNRVPVALSYILQVSSSPVFSKGTDPATGNPMTVEVTALPSSAQNASAYYAFTTLSSNFGAAVQRNIYWRMGARVDADPAPIAISDPNQNNWVFSTTRSFTISAAPPAPAKNRQGGSLLQKGTQSGRQHERLLRR